MYSTTPISPDSRSATSTALENRPLKAAISRLGIALAVVCLLAGCSPDAPIRTSDTATPNAPVAAGVPVTTFRSHAFVIPFSLRMPPWLPTEVGVERSTFVSWDASDGSGEVRMMAPVSVYRPGAANASAVPADFTRYILGLRAAGVTFTGRMSTTVSGHPATVVTATSTNALDGAFGCPTQHLAAADCFGFQPDLVLRIAMIDVDGRPLVFWLREDAESTTVADTVAPFAHLLDGLRLIATPGVTYGPM